MPRLTSEEGKVNEYPLVVSTITSVVHVAVVNPVAAVAYGVSFFRTVRAAVDTEAAKYFVPS